MGEYIPLPGGRRLSSYGVYFILHYIIVSRTCLYIARDGLVGPAFSVGEPSPSPAHYRPNTARTLPKSPRHSMHGQLYPLKREWHTKLILVNNCFIYTFGIYRAPKSKSL